MQEQQSVVRIAQEQGHAAQAALTPLTAEQRHQAALDFVNDFEPPLVSLVHD